LLITLILVSLTQSFANVPYFLWIINAINFNLLINLLLAQLNTLKITNSN
jgi:hypothetical protein